MQILNLDLAQKTNIDTLYAKQGDVGRKFQIALTDNGRSYSPDSDCQVSIWYAGASGEGNYSQINGTAAATISANTITVELIAQMLLLPGSGKLCVILNTAEGEQLGLWNILYMVDATPGADSAEAQQYYTAFSEVLRLLPTIGQEYDGTVEVS